MAFFCAGPSSGLLFSALGGENARVLGDGGTTIGDANCSCRTRGSGVCTEGGVSSTFAFFAGGPSSAAAVTYIYIYNEQCIHTYIYRERVRERECERESERKRESVRERERVCERKRESV